MSVRRERRFGKLVSDNVAGHKNNVQLVKASKRGIDGENVGPAAGVKKARVCHPEDQENVENVHLKKDLTVKQALKQVCDAKDAPVRDTGLTKTIESHVRKLDLDDGGTRSRTDASRDSSSTGTSDKSGVRVTRSLSQKIACRPSAETVPVDPELLLYRKSVNFADPVSYYKSPADLPVHVPDFDKSQLRDMSSEPHYAHDVFSYYKEKELQHLVPKYMHNQPQLKKSMRAVLVDWMVEVQESFELNHETLYLAVKMVDQYFSKKFLTKDRFQLLGATCMLMASKYDERLPASIDDFLYICDDAYSRRDMILMEMDVFRTLNFFLGYPLSYRFLRRYARCASLTMETLTLSRYVLETSLMDYDLALERDSKVAAAALLLALRMKQQKWVSLVTDCTDVPITEPRLSSACMKR